MKKLMLLVVMGVVSWNVAFVGVNANAAEVTQIQGETKNEFIDGAYDLVFNTGTYESLWNALIGAAEAQFEKAPYYEEFKADKDWYANNPDKEIISIQGDGNETLKGYYLKNPASDGRTAIIAHGYRGNALDMGTWAKMYYDLGYNVLTPDARSHGMNARGFASFGWQDKKDYVQWINKMNELNGDTKPIVLQGVSMGAATVMMAAGEELPGNVKAVIEDCGYTVLSDQVKHLLPLFIGEEDPVATYNGVNDKLQTEQGHKMEDVSSMDQLTKSELPVLFIHGEKDTFVPTDMVYPLYNNYQGEKELYTIPDAGHGMSLAYDLPNYQEKVKSFLGKHVQ
ncbi:alpha/beta hydrolase [Listeria grandensis]|uniref:Alpha/beta hydrolase n=1 Tax=Listeria grandensis TaxID=1494963 RepID=A0A7X1CPC2_9LIST|nr:alpha/beta hydrolase [Listeria grandensis]MBC1935860.1 alpha/beta hydrolase [Listeria grandensis]